MLSFPRIWFCRPVRIPLRTRIDTTRDALEETGDRCNLQGWAMTQLEDAARDAIDAVAPSERDDDDRD